MAAIEIPGALISGRKRVQGWASGTPSDSEDTLRLPLDRRAPIVESFRWRKFPKRTRRMTSGQRTIPSLSTM